MYYGRCHDIERNRVDGKTGTDRIRNPYDNLAHPQALSAPIFLVNVVGHTASMVG